MHQQIKNNSSHFYWKDEAKVLLRLIIMFLFITLLTQMLVAQADTSLRVTLPKSGKLINGKPKGTGWINLLTSRSDWNFEDSFWKLEDGVLYGNIGKEKEHHYGYTNATYTDFELNVMIKVVGDADANSGVCARIQPTSYDDAPGYQFDMGKGYWASLWEERRGNMIQKFPQDLAEKIVRKNDWNHYYIKCQGHHIQAWFNGVKTIDIVHTEGFLEGKIGFQLCHLHEPTTVEVKSLYLRAL